MTAASVNLYTIGFTRKSAEQFFTRLQAAGVRRVVDIRLKNVSQLAGFAKKPDLAYFLRAIAQIDYVHRPELAPTADILTAYKKAKGDWDVYAEQFLRLMTERRVEECVPRELLADGCLLCSEATAEHCHRRLVAEYLQAKWGDLNIVHL